MKESTGWSKHYNGAIYLPFSCDAAVCRCCDEHRTPMAADYRQERKKEKSEQIVTENNMQGDVLESKSFELAEQE